MHTLVSDIIILWAAALVLSFASMMFGAISIQDRETFISTYGSIGIILLAALVVTIGQLIGWIGVW